jgi:hypothetical protein
MLPRAHWHDLLNPSGLLGLAALGVALALARSEGAFEPLALGLVTLSLCLALCAIRIGDGTEGPGAATVAGEEPAHPTGDLGATGGLLLLGLAACLLLDSSLPPGLYADQSRLGALPPLLVSAALLSGTYALAGAPPWLSRSRFWALLLVAAALGYCLLRASPYPRIDVFDIQQGGLGALLHGQSPYARAYPNIYGPGTPFVSPEALSPDGLLIRWNPYTPLIFLVELPFAFFRLDHRWALLLSQLLAAAAIRRLGGRTRTAELCGLLVLFQPRGLFVLEQSWTEPTVLVAFCLALLAAARWRESLTREQNGARGLLWTGLAGALLLSTKQYAPLLAVPIFFALPRSGRRTSALVAVAGALATLLPFFLWTPRAFLDGVVRFQLLAPFRDDALSWLAALARMGGPRLPPWPGFLLAFAALLFGLRRTILPARAAAVTAASFLCLVLFNKQAFCNYYWLVAGLLLTATSLYARPPHMATPSRGRPC